MRRVAVLLTVYNRCAATLKGLSSLYKAIGVLGDGYVLDIYMTDDGSTDGTAAAVGREFPNIHIVQGNGKLYWSGGMRKAWQAAIESKKAYDFFLWFNDDVDLYEDAFVTLFGAYEKSGPDCIVTGAFCGHDGKTSYGGKFEEGKVIEPNGAYQDVTLMNGNLVLVPFIAYSKLGAIDKKFKHGFGDYDYGLRAQKNHFKVMLTAKYVGVCDRHDPESIIYYSKELSMWNRLCCLYNPFNNPIPEFVFYRRKNGLYFALKQFVGRNIFALFPQLMRK